MTATTLNSKSKGARFVRFYPSDWRSGCFGMTLEQEGLYVRICAYIYDTSRRLPLDDSAAAKFLGAHTNAYRKIRDQLAAIGKLAKCDDGWTVNRAERELAKATSAHSEGAVERQADQGEERNTRQDTLGDTPPDSPHNTHGVFSETANEINGPSLEPITNSQYSTPKPPQGAEVGKAIGANVIPISDWSTAFAQPEASDVIRTESGIVVLLGKARALWLEKFGDADRLEAALLEVSGAINQGSRKPLAADVQGRLGRILGQKIDSDKRYRDAVASRSSKPATAPHHVSPDTVRFAKPDLSDEVAHA